MIKKTFFIGVFLLFFLFNTKKILATLKINEIYPAPTTNEYEWIELYNDEDNQINIEEFYLVDLANNKIKIDKKFIDPLEFFIATSTSILNNNGDTIFLKNNFNQILEIATYSGSFDSNKSYGKCPDGNGNWFILNQISKGFSNKISCIFLTPTPTETPTIIPTNTPNLTPTLTILSPTPNISNTPTPTPISYENIYLSEVMVYPLSGENEWVEIYNDNNFSVFLNNWYLDDVENGGSTLKMFSLEIPAKNYKAIILNSSIFNNSGDSVRLLDFNKNLKDSFEYYNSLQGKTYGRQSLDNDNFCLQEPSFELVNNPCLNQNQPSNTTTNILANTPKKNDEIKKELPTLTPNLKTLNYVKKFNNFSSPTIIPLDSEGEVLGITNNQKNNQLILIKTLSFLSFSYSLLTIFAILFKIKIIYEKAKRIFSSFIYSQ